MSAPRTDDEWAERTAKSNEATTANKLLQSWLHKDPGEESDYELYSARTSTIRGCMIALSYDADTSILDERDIDKDCPQVDRETIIRAICALWASEYHRDDLSTIAMDLSLCPLHFIDWAICFDDQDPDCSQIRSVFPTHHDT